MKLTKTIDDKLIAEEILRLEGRLNDWYPETKEYNELLDRLERLYSILRDNRKIGTVSKDALLAVGANVAGILMILNHERLHVITTKALGFVIKGRV